MATYTKRYTVDYSQTGDTVKSGVQKVDDNTDQIISDLNACHTGSRGDMIYKGATQVEALAAPSTAGSILKHAGTGGDPAWSSSVTINTSGDVSITRYVLRNKKSISTYGDSLNAAVTQIGADSVTLVIDTTVTLSTSITSVPSNITVEWVYPGKIDFGNYNITTWSAPFANDPLWKVFDYTGTGTVTFGTGAVPYVRPEWWGALVSGASDSVNATGLNDAIQSLASGMGVKLPPGSFNLASATINGLSNNAFTIPVDDVFIECDNRWATTLTLTGTSECGILYIADKSGIRVKNIHFKGNNQSTVATQLGTAIWVINTGASNLSNFLIEDCKFENFRGAGWVNFTINSTGNITDVYIRRNEFPDSGSDRDPASAGVHADRIRFIGSSTGIFQKVWVKDNVMDVGTGKIGIGFQYDAEDVWIEGNYIKDNGQDNLSAISYGIMVYGSTAKRFHINHNTIENPYECGIYMAEGYESEVIGNRITGQDSTSDGTLAKGGIALNSPLDIRVIGNICDDCAYGINIFPPGSSESGVVISSNVLKSCTDGVRIKLSGTTDTGGIAVVANLFESCTNAIQLAPVSSPTYKLVDVSIIGNTILGASTGIVTGTDSKLENLRISNNKISATTRGLWIKPGTHYLVVSDNEIRDSTEYAMFIQGSYYVSITNNYFENIKDGVGGAYVFYLADVRGALIGNSWYDVDNVVEDVDGLEDLGRQKPTWTAEAHDGMFVQYINVQAASAAIYGWVYAGDWYAVVFNKGETAKGSDSTGTNVFSANANALGPNDGFIELAKADHTVIYVPYWTNITP